MRAIVMAAALCVAGGLVVFVMVSGVRQPTGAVRWRVDAPRSVHWTLTCDFAWVKMNDPYNPRNWVNQMERADEGSKSGHLPGDDGRCTLTETAGRGTVRLTLVKENIERSEVTDMGADPAYVVVY